MKLADLIGKKVSIEEMDYSCAVRDGQPKPQYTTGVLQAVEGHMVFFRSCVTDRPNYAEKQHKDIWFNTMASTFIKIERV